MLVGRLCLIFGLLTGVSLSVCAAELEPTHIEIILDASYSMAESVPGGVKIDVAKDGILRLINTLPRAYTVGLRIYGHRFPQDELEKSCTDTELVFPMQTITQEKRTSLKQRLTAVHPQGRTPISYTLKQAANDFVDLEGKKLLILVSDGEETCGGDPLAVADYIAGLGVGLRVYVIGFDVISREQLEGIAVRTGGVYYDARNAIELTQALQSAVEKATSLLFFDGFDDEMSPAWRTNPVGGTSLGVENGQLTLIGDRQEDQIISAWVGDLQWQDYILSVDVTFDVGYWAQPPWVRDHHVVLYVRAQDHNNAVGFFLQPGGESGFRVKRHGIWGDMLAAGTVQEVYGFHVVLVAEGSIFSAVLNDTVVATADITTHTAGHVGLQCTVDYGDLVYFDNVMVTPIE